IVRGPAPCSHELCALGSPGASARDGKLWLRFCARWRIPVRNLPDVINLSLRLLSECILMLFPSRGWPWGAREGLPQGPRWPERGFLARVDSALRKPASPNHPKGRAKVEEWFAPGLSFEAPSLRGKEPNAPGTAPQQIDNIPRAQA